MTDSHLDGDKKSALVTSLALVSTALGSRTSGHPDASQSPVVAVWVGFSGKLDKEV